jgi:Zn-dependent protease with chaperone function
MENKNKFFGYFLLPYTILGAITALILIILETFIFKNLLNFEYNIIDAIPFSIELFIVYYNYLTHVNEIIPEYDEMNYELSSEYSQKFEYLTGKNNEIKKKDIYNIDYFPNFFNYSGVNLLNYSKNPVITIDKNLIKILNNSELDALILHELYHFITHKTALIKRTIAYVMTILFFSIVLTLLTIFLYNVNKILGFEIVFTFVSLIIILYILLHVILINDERKCDIFSINVLNHNYISSALMKSIYYEKPFLNENTFNRLLKINSKRLKKLDDYNETHRYK